MIQSDTEERETTTMTDTSDQYPEYQAAHLLGQATALLNNTYPTARIGDRVRELFNQWMAHGGIQISDDKRADLARKFANGATRHQQTPATAKRKASQLKPGDVVVASNAYAVSGTVTKIVFKVTETAELTHTTGVRIYFDNKTFGKTFGWEFDPNVILEIQTRPNPSADSDSPAATTRTIRCFARHLKPGNILTNGATITRVDNTVKETMEGMRTTGVRVYINNNFLGNKVDPDDIWEIRAP